MELSEPDVFESEYETRFTIGLVQLAAKTYFDLTKQPITRESEDDYHTNRAYWGMGYVVVSSLLLPGEYGSEQERFKAWRRFASDQYRQATGSEYRLLHARKKTLLSLERLASRSFMPRTPTVDNVRLAQMIIRADKSEIAFNPRPDESRDDAFLVSPLPDGRPSDQS